MVAPTTPKPNALLDVGKLRQTSSYKRYYSGNDVSLYFGNTYVEEAVNIQYQLAENVLPLYGYAQHSFKEIARGTRVVQGTFTLNFTDPDEIYMLLRRMGGMEPNELVKAQKSAVTASGPEVSTYAYSVSDYSVNEKMLLSTTMDVLNETQRALQDAHWGTVKAEFNPKVMVDFNLPRLGVGSSGATVAAAKREMLRGFPLTIKFDKRDMDMEMYDKAMQARIIGNPKTKAIPVETLTNVHLSTMSRAIDSGGQAIVSIYTFIASDVIPGWQDVKPETAS